MFIFRYGGRRAALVASTNISSRRYASRIDIPIQQPSFPVIEACPSPTCSCREAPQGLEIEREQNIAGSLAGYAEQILISTGRDDWKSRIEEEDDAVLVKQLKRLLGRDGKYSDPFHNVMITNSSFAPTTPPQHQREASGASTVTNGSTPSSNSGSPDPTSSNENASYASAFLLPSFQYIPTIPTTTAGVDALVKAFIQPSQLHQSHDSLTREQQNVLLRQPERQKQFVGARKVDEILILICGHGGRDSRCGVLGPLLRDEFKEKLQRQNIPLLVDPPVAEAVEVETEVEGYTPTARVGLISHIGGHKWAGNVIIYIPPSFKSNPLAGHGIWYSRVGPEHVEGIVAKTILEGKVIKEMFRGGIDADRQILRL